jgi:AraC-like DNA-binding protein
MDEAALMLESGDDAIAQIATRVGYETTTAFSKAFKQHYSFSPGRYRTSGGTGPLSSPHLYTVAGMRVGLSRGDAQKARREQ